MKKNKVMIAFGGNALLKAGQKGTFAEQNANVKATCKALLSLFSEDKAIVIGHGNGPQVGNVMLQHAAGENEHGIVAMPMDFCVAETQGSIAYLIENNLQNLLAEKNIHRKVVSLVTQVLVDAADTAFQNPKKPVGPYYTKEQVDNFPKDGSVYAEDPKGNGWRKVVASPKPIDVKNIDIVQELAEQGHFVITVGGGGIPVVLENGKYIGKEAVIDKDLASALAAIKIGAKEFYIITDVSNAYINFRKENEQKLEQITVEEAKKHLADGQFSEGSMAPKIRAAIYFAENSGGKCVITNAENLTSGGTIILP
ncbi:MAG: carbamate kinase [Bacteroidales bacterium]|jgi:carbamate kinase|nr:carbamate kinase [Bacteroidales bacterium]